MRKLDWVAIQKAYDEGMSQRDLRKTFGVHFKSMKLARERGDFKARSHAEAIAKYVEYNGHRPVSIMGNEARHKLSVAQSQQNRGGKCKWFEVSGQKVQGTWERQCAFCGVPVLISHRTGSAPKSALRP